MNDEERAALLARVQRALGLGVMPRCGDIEALCAALAASETELAEARKHGAWCDEQMKYCWPRNEFGSLLTPGEWAEARILIERQHLAIGDYGRTLLLKSAELAEARREREALRALIADDGYALTFQTMGQYRSALLQAALGADAEKEDEK